MICVTIGRSRHKATIADFKHLAENGVELVELRLDYIARHIDMTRLLADRPCQLIITCRRREDGGRWEKSEDERLMVLRNSIASGVDFVDLEEDIAGTIPRYGSTKRIVSYHNFDETPADLDEIHARLAALDADVVKIATMANSFTDSIRMMRMAEKAKVPTVAICMGELGTVTRLMALRYGAPFTFAVMPGGRKIAPGQIRYDLMRDVYKVHDIDEETKIYGVVADPVAHSLSPQIHNAAFHHDNLNCRYFPFRVPEDELPLFMQWCKESGLGGLSVTIPHKESSIRLMSEVESAANGIGAINTVAIRGMDAVGYNTDYRAAMDCMEEALRTQKTVGNVTEELHADDLFRGRTALILGAGGVARAIGYGLRQRGAIVTIAGKTQERAATLASDIGGKVVPWSARHKVRPGILINCTPVGMHPDVDSCPFEEASMEEDTIVFDTIYNPEQTLLVKRAKKKGCFVINGLDMFVRQAAYQYKLFTGLEPPVKEMRSTVKRETSPVRF